MKKVLTYLLLALAVIYGVGFYTLGEGGVTRFLEKVDAMSNAGDAKGFCDLLTDDMKVAIIDHTVEIDRRLGDGKVNGGKTELCAFAQANFIPMTGGMAIQTERHDLKVTRQTLLHPWTADVSYTEKKSATIQAGARSLTIKTESDDKWKLEMTFSGVKVKRLESEAWLQ